LNAFEKVRAAGTAADFSRAGYAREAAGAINSGVADTVSALRSARKWHQFTDGWAYPRPDLGNYGGNYIFRAIIAPTGLGALTLAEAIYLRPEGDNKSLFFGDGLYRLSLARPIPIGAFWPLTMYEAAGDGRFFLTKNPLNRHSIGDRTERLVYGPNGALDIWIGRSDPGGLRHGQLAAGSQTRAILPDAASVPVRPGATRRHLQNAADCFGLAGRIRGALVGLSSRPRHRFGDVSG
jgi:hypothetical protein